jgi:hypothetical protein
MKPFEPAEGFDMYSQSSAGISSIRRRTLEKTMTKILLALGLCLICADAQAISRYDPTGMDCAGVQATLAREGAVILRYQSTRTPALPLYNRYVGNGRFCGMGEVRARASVPSADVAACPVYNCKPAEFDRHRRWWLPFD